MKIGMALEVKRNLITNDLNFITVTNILMIV